MTDRPKFFSKTGFIWTLNSIGIFLQIAVLLLFVSLMALCLIVIPVVMAVAWIMGA